MTGARARGERLRGQLAALNVVVASEIGRPGERSRDLEPQATEVNITKSTSSGLPLLEPSSVSIFHHPPPFPRLTIAHDITWRFDIDDVANHTRNPSVSNRGLARGGGQEGIVSAPSGANPELPLS